MYTKALLSLLFVVFGCYATQQVPNACPNPIENATVPTGYCAYTLASGLQSPRGIYVAENNDILVVERGLGQVTVMWDANNDGVISASEKAALASEKGLNHWVLANKGLLYASSASTVFSWPYNAGDRTNLGKGKVVVHSIPTCCDHVTRSFAFDNNATIYVQVGSGSNVDPNWDHAQIKTFYLPDMPSGGFNWIDGTTFAAGLRNEAGIRMDGQGRLWGVENGVDNLNRPDLGGDIHTNNPSEELNLFDTPGKFYGYPYCWSEWMLAKGGKGVGSQYVHENFINEHPYSDDWCNNNTNVVKPKMDFPAHMAPLDIVFYGGPGFTKDGNAFISFHGSWDRQPPAGYKVMEVNYKNGMPNGFYPFFYFKGPGDTGNGWPYRPVGLGFAKTAQGEALIISSDVNGEIVAVAKTSE